MFERKKKRRERLMRTPLPPEWLAIVERNVPYYRLLPHEDRVELGGLIQAFLAEKRFEGCDGLEITDEIRLTIAAHACVLLLHRATDIYPLLQSILVYPRAFVAPLKERAPGGIVIEDFEEREGESWDTGALILSWDDVSESVTDADDGYNVVFHEFAHQLDDEAGIADGAPPLKKKSMYAAWARVFGAEYEALAEAPKVPRSFSPWRRRRSSGYRRSSKPDIRSFTSSSACSTSRILLRSLIRTDPPFPENHLGERIGPRAMDCGSSESARRAITPSACGISGSRP
jgi:Mlc titration factor MtfA (ptsG expression regulator)